MKMNKTIERKSWSKEDDKVLLNNVNSYPSNLRVAFEETAKSLDRTVSAVSARYYTNLKDNNLAITVVSKGGIATMHNQKNARRDLSSKLSEEDIFQIAMSNLVKMNRNYKKKAIEILMNL
jgi:hypothetical protein